MKQALLYGKTKLLFACLLIMAGSPACHIPGEQDHGTSRMDEGKPQYARGFRIEGFTDYKILHVINPWQGSRRVHFKYILTEDPSLIPDSLKPHPLIRIPVKRVVCMSTTHVAMIDALGESDAIVGISGSDYISNPALRSKLETGEVRDVGADQTLNYELILTLHPDLVIAYGITAEVSGMVKRLEGLGIPVILNGDYLEDQPLGKTEWIRFLAPFFAEDTKADSIFRSVATSYERYKELIRNTRDKPSVMTGLPWKDTWYIPGGQSFAAAYIRDAGGTYLWEDLDSREAIPLDLESIFARAASADLWINCGAARNLAEIVETDKRLNRFQPAATGRVFNNNARINPAGGNDFWESGVMAPHLILADLINIFHPEILPDHELVYYNHLE
jgi:iron complex transport system substrate-binding protein